MHFLKCTFKWFSDLAGHVEVDVYQLLAQEGHTTAVFGIRPHLAHLIQVIC